MRTFQVGIFVAMMITALTTGTSSQGGGTSHNVTQADFERWKTELSNWGRWGKDDEIGALNLITAAKRKQAAALVKEGVSVSLGREVLTEKAVDNPQPFEHTMTGVGSDKIAVSFHGFAHTHMDAMGHVFFDGKAYNGYAPVEAEVMKAGGHAKNSIYNVKNGVFTRGILMDIPRLKGVPYLELGTPVYAEDLEAWEKKAGVKVGAGDALFIRTGRWARRAAVGPYPVTSNPTGKSPGLHVSVIPWLKQRDIALIASETGLALSDSASPMGFQSAAHHFSLIILGVTVIDDCDLDAVSEKAAALKRWEFLLTVAPLPIRGGTGSPVNPIATF